MSKITTIPVSHLEPGDQVINKGRDVYKVIEVVEHNAEQLLLRVQWADGAFDVRAWNAVDFDHPVQIIKPA